MLVKMTCRRGSYLDKKKRNRRGQKIAGDDAACCSLLT